MNTFECRRNFYYNFKIGFSLKGKMDTAKFEDRNHLDNLFSCSKLAILPSDDCLNIFPNPVNSEGRM